MDVLLTSAAIVIAAYSTIMLATLAGFSSAARMHSTGRHRCGRHGFSMTRSVRPNWRSYDWLQESAPPSTL